MRITKKVRHNTLTIHGACSLSRVPHQTTGAGNLERRTVLRVQVAYADETPRGPQGHPWQGAQARR